MALLKKQKIRANTLVETITASVLILIVFTIAGNVINGVFQSAVKTDMRKIATHIDELIYLYQNKKIDSKYSGAMEEWEIFLEEEQSNGIRFLRFKAIDSITKKDYSKEVPDVFK